LALVYCKVLHTACHEGTEREPDLQLFSLMSHPRRLTPAKSSGTQWEKLGGQKCLSGRVFGKQEIPYSHWGSKARPSSQQQLSAPFISI